MKIKEMVERDCCDQRDMKPYRGGLPEEVKRSRMFFCQHCGQLWCNTSYTDAAGGRDTQLVKVPLSV